MFEIEWTLNGKKVGPENMGDAFERAIMEEVEEMVRSRVEDIRCPEHGEGPRSVTVHKTAEGFNFDIKACCTKLTDAIKAEFADEEDTE